MTTLNQIAVAAEKIVERCCVDSIGLEDRAWLIEKAIRDIQSACKEATEPLIKFAKGVRDSYVMITNTEAIIKAHKKNIDDAYTVLALSESRAATAGEPQYHSCHLGACGVKLEPTTTEPRKGSPAGEPSRPQPDHRVEKALRDYDEGKALDTLPAATERGTERGTERAELLKRLNNHIAFMAPHQKDRQQGKLLIEARDALSQQPKP